VALQGTGGQNSNPMTPTDPNVWARAALRALLKRLYELIRLGVRL